MNGSETEMKPVDSQQNRQQFGISPESALVSLREEKSQRTAGGRATENLVFLRKMLDASLTDLSNASALMGSRQISRSQIDRIIKGQRATPNERRHITRAFLKLIIERWDSALLFRED